MKFKDYAKGAAIILCAMLFIALGTKGVSHLVLILFRAIFRGQRIIFWKDLIEIPISLIALRYGFKLLKKEFRNKPSEDTIREICLASLVPIFIFLGGELYSCTFLFDNAIRTYEKTVMAGRDVTLSGKDVKMKYMDDKQITYHYTETYPYEVEYDVTIFHKYTDPFYKTTITTNRSYKVKPIIEMAFLRMETEGMTEEEIVDSLMEQDNKVCSILKDEETSLQNWKRHYKILASGKVSGLVAAGDCCYRKEENELLYEPCHPYEDQRRYREKLEEIAQK